VSTDLLREAVGLKDVVRAGWVRAGVPSPETVAAHSWGVAWLVLVLLPDDLDRERALLYAVLHDLPEVRTGDVTPRDGVSAAAKHAREHASMAALCAELPPDRGAALLRVWEAYEAQADPEARFVRQLDRLDMAIQAVAYGTRHGLDLDEFVASAATVVTHPDLCAILDELRAR
jgi:5'-deoxynucleotidase YfbR-like HD superfamily hydrolase